MGREVRKVPADWEHPKGEDGRYIPLMSGSFAEEDTEWMEGWKKWQEGLCKAFMPEPGEPQWVPIEDEFEGLTFTEFHGGRPSPDDYMPDWPEEQRTHFMMYEDTTEGTPISPAFETPEELARWLADTGASAFGSQAASYDGWLRVCKGGYAPSAIYTPETGLQSGVDGLGN